MPGACSRHGRGNTPGSSGISRQFGCSRMVVGHVFFFVLCPLYLLYPITPTAQRALARTPFYGSCAPQCMQPCRKVLPEVALDFVPSHACNHKNDLSFCVDTTQQFECRRFAARRPGRYSRYIAAPRQHCGRHAQRARTLVLFVVYVCVPLEFSHFCLIALSTRHEP